MGRGSAFETGRCTWCQTRQDITRQGPAKPTQRTIICPGKGSAANHERDALWKLPPSSKEERGNCVISCTKKKCQESDQADIWVGSGPLKLHSVTINPENYGNQRRALNLCSAWSSMWEDILWSFKVLVDILGLLSSEASKNAWGQICLTSRPPRQWVVKALFLLSANL